MPIYLIQIGTVLLCVIIPLLVMIDLIRGNGKYSNKAGGVLCKAFGHVPNPKGSIRASTGRNCKCKRCDSYIPDADPTIQKPFRISSDDFDYSNHSFRSYKHTRRFLDKQYTHLVIGNDWYVPHYSAFGLRFDEFKERTLC